MLYGSCAAVIRDRSPVILVKNLVEEGQRRRTDVDGQTEGRTRTEGTTVRTDGQGGRHRRLDTTGQRDGRRKDYRKLGSSRSLALAVGLA